MYDVLILFWDTWDCPFSGDPPRCSSHITGRISLISSIRPGHGVGVVFPHHCLDLVLVDPQDACTQGVPGQTAIVEHVVDAPLGDTDDVRSLTRRDAAGFQLIVQWRMGTHIFCPSTR